MIMGKLTNKVSKLHEINKLISGKRSLIDFLLALTNSKHSEVNQKASRWSQKFQPNELAGLGLITLSRCHSNG